MAAISPALTPGTGPTRETDAEPQRAMCGVPIGLPEAKRGTGPCPEPGEPARPHGCTAPGSAF